MKFVVCRFGDDDLLPFFISIIVRQKKNKKRRKAQTKSFSPNPNIPSKLPSLISHLLKISTPKSPLSDNLETQSQLAAVFVRNLGGK